MLNDFPPNPPIGTRTGIGLRAPHIGAVRAQTPPLGFLEVHTENYFGGGAKLKVLEGLRVDYPLSFHGVGLSLGRADGLCEDHLAQVRTLVKRFEPALVSEHLSWSAYAHVAVPDLLPVPFTHEALDVFARHIDRFQTVLGRQVLIENPSNYMIFDRLDYDEPEFLLRLSAMTGCGLLIDINNVYVSAHNLGRDSYAYLAALGHGEAIGQFHLAGHDEAPGDDGQVLLIDTHGHSIRQEVWALYETALERFGDRPTLIEWDTALPDLDVLLGEAARADARRARVARNLMAASHA
ncbi:MULTISPECIES: DUF692 domain-containing protein [Asticcacaulis]|uniref:MNIO family bufferin maturase n=1 Tax=Asticcacaulis TaxID=76890 RepID=UPI001AE6D237|nr:MULTISPECIES: DUF692 domain-containing protein [Asticcacaulis]MBP2157681.1 uncharacterized protein (UPF0276 family) [Asticcacaulis solisilvae]MDR6798726.1 uncharacterized protein (UPF0276 family) [Asticcacaulis sp. BE141]